MSPEDQYEFEVPVKKTKFILYAAIALVAAIFAYIVLVEEPSTGWPLNLIHLLARH